MAKQPCAEPDADDMPMKGGGKAPNPIIAGMKGVAPKQSRQLKPETKIKQALKGKFKP